MNKFKNKYRIPSTRLQNWDYGSNGFYFVTICTKNRDWFFGDIIIEPSTVGQTDGGEIGDNDMPTGGGADRTGGGAETQNIASLREQPIMTNSKKYLQRFTTIGNIAGQFWSEIPNHFPFVELDEYVIMPNHVHGIILINKPEIGQSWTPNTFGPQSMNLGSIIRGYKAGVKVFATTNNIAFSWQPRYHDHIIRSNSELQRIRKYIINNPMKWDKDINNCDKLLM